MAKRLTNEEWISKAKNKFPNLDFSNTQYINKRSNITVRCPIHGEFTSMAGGFMETKYGCPKCGHEQSNQKRMTSQEDYISKIKIAYNSKYDCSKVVYKGSKDKITLVCPKHGEFQIRADNFNANCPKCSQSYKRNHEEFVQELKEKFPSIEIIEGKFETVRSILTFKCSECGNMWESTPAHILASKYGCSKCAHVNAKIPNRMKSEDFLKKIREISPEIEILSEYTTSRNRIKCRCSKCNNEWNPKAIYLLQGYKCPKCSKQNRGFRNEQVIINYLNNKNINFICQFKITKPFEGRNYIEIDFYLPDYNLFIEYNGKQHYVPIEYFGGEIAFKNRVKRDENLRNYCKENNINLLEIRYDQNIEEKLDEYFNKQEQKI